MREFLIKSNDCGQRIDKFISKAMPELPKSMMYKLIRKKDIKINNKRCEVSTILNEGDIVRIYAKESVEGVKSHDMSFLNAKLPDIVYEDGNIIAVYKPIGVDSHSNGSNQDDTLINRVKLYLYNKGEYTPDSENSFAPALCNRLDRNTCGIVISAKNAESLREVNTAIRDGLVHKIYHCVTVSKPPKNSDIITAYHKKDDTRNIVRISDSLLDGYKEIKTGYKVIGQKNNLTLLEITLYTGRTHQIRSHLAHIGSPVLGDGKYGDVTANKRYGVFRQALCAYSLEFEFPENSKFNYLNNIEIKSPKPDFENLFD